MAKMSFRVTESDGDGGGGGERKALPAGEYSASIIDSEIKANKKGTGSYLKLTWCISGGEHDGRFVWDNITHEHNNPVAVEIGRKKLVRLARVLGVTEWEDTMELHNNFCRIKVDKRVDPTYGEGNDVVGYSVSRGSAPAAPAAPVSNNFNDDDIPF